MGRCQIEPKHLTPCSTTMQLLFLLALVPVISLKQQPGDVKSLAEHVRLLVMSHDSITIHNVNS